MEARDLSLLGVLVVLGRNGNICATPPVAIHEYNVTVGIRTFGVVRIRDNSRIRHSGHINSCFAAKMLKKKTFPIFWRVPSAVFFFFAFFSSKSGLLLFSRYLQFSNFFWIAFLSDCYLKEKRRINS